MAEVGLVEEGDQEKTCVSNVYRMPSSFTIHLSSNVSSYTASSMEATIATVEPHGAILLTRFVSGGHAEQFELSGAEFDALLAMNRRRRSLMKQSILTAYSELGLPF